MNMLIAKQIDGQQLRSVLALESGFCAAVAPGVVIGNDNGAREVFGNV